MADDDSLRMAKYALRLERVRQRAIHHIEALLGSPDPSARASARAFLEEQRRGHYTPQEDRDARR